MPVGAETGPYGTTSGAGAVRDQGCTQKGGDKMPEVLKQEPVTVEHLPRLFRSRALDYTLMIIGAVVAAFGAYTYFAPSDWVLADLAEAWHLASWIAGGVLLAAAFGMLGASLRDRSGHWTTSAVMSFLIGTLALAGAVAAAVVLIV
jgi:hypothetical protein